MLTRREVLKAGAAVGAAALLGGTASPETRPNFLIILTDQTRFPMHWPAGWAEHNLPSWKRLRERGLTFRRAYCAVSQCSPSRAALFTGAYANVNGCQLVGGRLNTPAEGVPNLATMLSDVGYDVVYKGKWHLSAPANGKYWTADDIGHLQATYGWAGWNPPDLGSTAGARGPTDYASLSTLGGGYPNNDGRVVAGVTPGAVAGPAPPTTGEPAKYLKPTQFIPYYTTQAPPPPGQGVQTRGFGESALDYLAKPKTRPFCLVVSLANPHDVAFYPDSYSYPAAGYPAKVPDQGIRLPANRDDSLEGKPSIQKRFRGTLKTDEWTLEEQTGYCNFYAYLHREVDAHIVAVLDALDKHGLTDDTIILRTADHGELGLSHGLLEKAYCTYDEGLNVPLIVSNPKMFPQPRTTDAIWSHIDLTATLAELAGARKIGVGKSQVPVLKGERPSVRDVALFSFDDDFGPVGIELTDPASHIRALRTDRYTYGVYFTATYAGDQGSSVITAGPPYEYELYDNHQDPLQMKNLASTEPALRKRLHERLRTELVATGSLPPGFP